MAPSLQTDLKYLVISPVRNEAEHLDDVIAGVVAQTIRPVEWILVDDGSTDETPAIIERATRDHAWIKGIRRSDRGQRAPGSGVIQAFYDGYQGAITRDWHFLVKLDGDIVLEPDYFERCFREFARDPRLGIGGGLIEGTNAKPEAHPDFHVRGATKIYRRECWDGIGGLLKSPGWDTVDELHAHYLGWNTRTFRDIKIVHLRPTGSADGSWRDSVKNGLANYVSAYHPVFMLVKCAKRLAVRPYVLHSVGLLWGYLGGYFADRPRITDAGLIAYIHKQQLRRLMLRSSIWQ